MIFLNKRFHYCQKYPKFGVCSTVFLFCNDNGLNECFLTPNLGFDVDDRPLKKKSLNSTVLPIDNFLLELSSLTYAEC